MLDLLRSWVWFVLVFSVVLWDGMSWEVGWALTSAPLQRSVQSSPLPHTRTGQDQGRAAKSAVIQLLRVLPELQMKMELPARRQHWDSKNHWDSKCFRSGFLALACCYQLLNVCIGNSRWVREMQSSGNAQIRQVGSVLKLLTHLYLMDSMPKETGIAQGRWSICFPLGE